MKSIINGILYLKQQFVKDQVIIFDDNIIDICSIDEYKIIKNKFSNIKEIDAKDQFVVPGFIDVHIHGYEGVDVMDGEEEALLKLSSSITKNGVTAYLPTTMTMSMEAIKKALTTIRYIKANNNALNSNGAIVLGAHLEGPFINENYKGAQPKEFITSPDIELIKEFKDVIKVVTIAPEIKGAKECIETFSKDIRFSIGHSGATFEQAKEAIESGASSITHLFNAMTGLHHRNPGIVGAALTCDCYSEVIADKFHVHPELFQMIVKAKNLEKILLITDCMRAGGLHEGTHDLGGQKVRVKNNQCRLEDNTIAGSVLKLNEALKNFHDSIEEKLEEVIPLVTINQAKYLGIENQMGSLDIGKMANINIIDSSITINKTIVKGKVVYENQL